MNNKRLCTWQYNKGDEVAFYSSAPRGRIIKRMVTVVSVRRDGSIKTARFPDGTVCEIERD